MPQLDGDTEPQLEKQDGIADIQPKHAIPDRLDTPPTTPIETESRSNSFDKQKVELEIELKNLDDKIEITFNSIKAKRENVIVLRSKRYLVEDYLEIATRSQVEVRNLLNNIYNPGLELAKRANVLIDETRRSHKDKLEKMTFELNQIVENAQSWIKKKLKQLDHETELHQRTLMTIECQKKHHLDQIREKAREMVKPEPVVEKDKDDSTISLNKSGNQGDDDCVIIEDMDEDDGESDLANEIELSRHTPESRGLEPVNGQNNQSETTVTCEYEGQANDGEENEDTDIEESKEEEEERSFTPCQAQRPN